MKLNIKFTILSVSLASIVVVAIVLFTYIIYVINRNQQYDNYEKQYQHNVKAELKKHSDYIFNIINIYDQCNENIKHRKEIANGDHHSYEVVDIEQVQKNELLSIINQYIEKERINFFIYHTEPPFRIVLKTSQTDLSSISKFYSYGREVNVFYEMVDLCKKVKESTFDFSYEEADGSSRELLSYINIYPKREWLLGVYTAHDVVYQHLLEEKELGQKIQNVFFQKIIFFSALLIAVLFVVFLQMSNKLLKIFYKINVVLDKLAKGRHVEPINMNNNNLPGKLSQAIDELIQKNYDNINFLKEITKGNYDAKLQSYYEFDIFARSLLEVKKSLIAAREGEQKRSKENEINNWISNGVGLFNDILRKGNEKIEQIADVIIKNLVDYLQANQGGLYIYNDDDKNDIHLELVASYAYNKKRFLTRKIPLGETLVGACAMEKSVIHQKNIPSDYIEIRSGLGGATPKNLLISPLLVENKVMAVVELASFKIFEEHERKFVERIGESIAVALSTAKINMKNQLLIKNSGRQAEELELKEEELKENIREIRKLQENYELKNREIQSIYSIIDEQIPVLKLNSQGRILTANKCVYDKFLLDSAIKDKSYFKIFPDSMLTDQQIENKWDIIISGENYKSKRFLIIGKNKFWIEEILEPLFDMKGELYAIQVILFDITELENHRNKLASQSL